MKKTNEHIDKYEAFVSSVLEKNFNQELDPENLRSAAQKVAVAVKVSKPKQRVRRTSYTGHAVPT